MIRMVISCNYIKCFSENDKLNNIYLPFQSKLISSTEKVGTPTLTVLDYGKGIKAVERSMNSFIQGPGGTP